MEKEYRITVCVWHEEGETSLAPGWYWDDNEDHGGFDRVSPNGPHKDRTSAELDALAIFRGAHVANGKPYYYPVESA